MLYYIVLPGSQTSLLEEFENDQMSFKEKILNLITDEPTKEKVDDKDPFVFDEDHKCILLDVGKNYKEYLSTKLN